jgi:nucleoid DNA-binding protein
MIQADEPLRRHMNKSELVSTIARRTEMSEKDVNAVLGEFITVVGEVVAKGGARTS